jgi:outer membrane receptor protein involved in Fe transport
MLGLWGRLCPRSCLRFASLTLTLCTSLALAQPPAEDLQPPQVPEDFTAAQLQPAEQPVEQPPEPLSTAQPTQLPEVEVQGRLNTFPAEPLPASDVISPTRTPQPASQTASSTTVITREQIERSGQSNVAEVLRGTIGVDVVRQGAPRRH